MVSWSSYTSSVARKTLSTGSSLVILDMMVITVEVEEEKTSIDKQGGASCWCL
jgi:hypothetical protein